MNKKIITVVQNPFITSSMIVFIGGLGVSFLNFVFNLFMSRNLSVVDYGILASLTSITTVSSLLSGWITPTAVHFAASYFAKEDMSSIRGLYLKITKISFVIGLFTFSIFFLFREQISSFFNISDSYLIVLINLSVFLGIMNIANMALLQAKLAFKFTSIINLIGSFLRLILGITAVLFGYMIGGVMWAFVISTLVPYLLTFIQLKFIFNKGISVPHISVIKLMSYGVPAAISLYGLGSLINTDIILVKHFFDPKNAGIYSGLALIGKVIFFFSAPIASVMFPIITQKHAKNENFRTIFKLSILLVLIPSLGFTISYFLFPEFMIRFFLKKDEYLTIAPILGFFGLFITMYSIVSVFVSFYLSIRKTIVYIPIIICALLQAGLIWFFHSTFLTIIFISLGCTSLLLIVLLLYYVKLSKEKN